MHPGRQARADGPRPRPHHQVIALVIFVACRSQPTTTAKATIVDAAPAIVDASVDVREDVRDAREETDAAPSERAIGPYQLPFLPKRNVYYAVSRSTKLPARLVTNLHGVCNPPGYACGYWTESASKVGFLVCPEGNSTCGAGGPPTWTEPHAEDG